MKKLTITLSSGVQEEVTVRGIAPIVYEEAARAVDAGDLMRIMELSCDRPAGWARMLSAEGFSDVLAASQEGNRGFFDFCSARASLAMLKDPMGALKNLPKDVLQELLAAREAGRTPSPS